jgi:hypothetical protein
VRLDVFNAQQQHRTVWPATPVVARAYLDQLTRGQGIPTERARAIEAALGGAERQDKDAAAQLGSLAAQLEGDAASATGRDAGRLRSLAQTLNGLAGGGR